LPADFTITQSDTIALAQDGWSVPVTFQQFDPSQGTLISAGLSLTGTVAGIAAVENLGVAAATVPISTAGTIVLNAGTVDVDSAAVVASGSVTLGAYDGSLDFQGPSGKIAVFTNSSPGTLAGNSGSLSAFVGTGTIGYTATSYAQVTEITNGNILSVTRGEAGATIDLRYVASQWGGGSNTAGSVITVAQTNPGIFITAPGFVTETTLPQILRVADATTGWDRSLSLNQFDPSLGTLAAVSITVVTDLNTSMALENLGSIAGTATLTDNGGFSLILPGMTAFNLAGPTLSANATLQAFDGTTDFAGASGTLVSGMSGTNSVTETIEQSLSSYIGNGTTTIDLSSFSPTVLIGPADLAAELLTNAGAVVEVSYIYTTTTSAAATPTLAISGTQPDLTTVEQTSVLPFSEVSITDPAVGQMETATVTISNPANGTLELVNSLPLVTNSYDSSTGIWTTIGHDDDVTGVLRNLAFVPAATISAGQSITTAFTISVTDTAGATATDATTSVTELPSVQIDTVAAAAAVQTALADTASLQIPCFTAGTRIATPSGPVTVENLREGDLVLTAAGTSRPIVWIGRRTVDCRRHPNPDRVRPIRIARHAFGMNCPSRTLKLSPDHAVYTDGVLIPVKFLLNGSTITQTNAAQVTYFHLELSSHDVILAENLPCESYLETGGRAGFENADAALALHPDFAGPDPDRVGTIWQTQACAPLIGNEDTLRRVQARLAFQALMLKGQSRRRSTRSGNSGALEISDTIAQ
jgi:hypothetical protein